MSNKVFKKQKQNFGLRAQKLGEDNSSEDWPGLFPPGSMIGSLVSLPNISITMVTITRRVWIDNTVFGLTIFGPVQINAGTDRRIDLLRQACPPIPQWEPTVT